MATAYALPVTLALLGKRVEKVGDLEEVVAEIRGWLPPVPHENLWVPYLGPALDAGAATLVAHETVEALKPLGGTPTQGSWCGDEPCGSPARWWRGEGVGRPTPGHSVGQA